MSFPRPLYQSFSLLRRWWAMKGLKDLETRMSFPLRTNAITDSKSLRLRLQVLSIIEFSSQTFAAPSFTRLICDQQVLSFSFSSVQRENTNANRDRAAPEKTVGERDNTKTKVDDFYYYFYYSLHFSVRT